VYIFQRKPTSMIHLKIKWSDVYVVGSIYDEGVDDGSGQTDDWMRFCRLYAID